MSSRESSNQVAETLQTGLYRHYKGKNYEVVSVARHCDTEEWYVVYRALYGERGMWIRSLNDFCAIVNCEDGKLPRFRYLGPVA